MVKLIKIPGGIYMDIFDNAVNKAKEAFDVACKKTGEVVNVQKNKFDLATLESKKAKDFEALGKIYYESVKDSADNSPNVQELVEAIKIKNDKIEELRKDIRIAKNKRVCPNCSSEVDKDAAFCSSCGAQLIFEDINQDE